MSDAAAAARSSYGSWRRPALVGCAVIAMAFGVLGGWSATAKVDSAVIAPGEVTIETNSKVVQHLEGGIISEILVKEGQHVDRGQVLLRLDDVQPKATADTYRDQLLGARVLLARLLAEREGRSKIELPPDLSVLHDNAYVAKAIADQTAQFETRRMALDNQISIMEARIAGLSTEISGLKIEQQSTVRQVGYINQELTGLRKLLERKLIPLDRVLSMERERVRLEGAIGQAIADQAKAKNSIGEARLQIVQLKHKFQEETDAAITEVRQRIFDLGEKLSVAQDILRRTAIRSPVQGTIQGLTVNGIGQVIAPGQKLMEVVPDDANLTVHARFSPQDIAHVHTGQEAEVRFPSFETRTTPVIVGRLASLSKDLLPDDASHHGHYLGIIMVDTMAIPRILKGKLRAGMPAEVIVSVGDRTILDYLIAPLTDAWRKSFRGP